MRKVHVRVTTSRYMYDIPYFDPDEILYDSLISGEAASDDALYIIRDELQQEKDSPRNVLILQAQIWRLTKQNP